MNLAYQRRVAARLLKCGLDRVWIDDRTEIQERIGEAVTRDDVRHLIVQKFIRKHQKKGISRGRARHRDAQRAKGRQRGHGARRGHAAAPWHAARRGGVRDRGRCPSSGACG